MSTVHDVADTGPVDPESEPESVATLGRENGTLHESADSRTKPSSIVELLQTVRKEELEQVNPENNRKTSKQDTDVTNEEEEASFETERQDLLSPVRLGPSSADGSLSTPDDTPSVQVNCEYFRDLTSKY